MSSIESPYWNSLTSRITSAVWFLLLLLLWMLKRYQVDFLTNNTEGTMYLHDAKKLLTYYITSIISQLILHSGKFFCIYIWLQWFSKTEKQINFPTFKVKFDLINLRFQIVRSVVYTCFPPFLYFFTFIYCFIFISRVWVDELKI